MEYAVAAAIINSRGRLHDIIAPYAAEAFGIQSMVAASMKQSVRRAAADELLFRRVE